MKNIIFMGTPEWAVPCLKVLLESPESHVSAVYTQPDRPAGRGQAFQPSPVKLFAQTQGLLVATPEKASTMEVYQSLQVLQPDLMIVCAYGQLLPQRLLDLPSLGCFNIHFSFLPRWRGASPVQAAIRAGDSSTGVSLQRMVKKLDAGPLVANSSPQVILPQETAQQLGERLSEVAADLLRQNLAGLLTQSLPEMPQNEAEVTYCRIIKKEEGAVRWNEETAIEIERKRRAFTPWPGVYTFAQGKRLQLLEVEVKPDFQSRPGWVNSGLIIGTKEGGIQVKRLKPEGKKEMSAEEFLRGYSSLLGTCLDYD